jgi:hypothetical protein
MSGVKGMRGSGGKRDNAGRPPTRRIIRPGDRFTTDAGETWTISEITREGITITTSEGRQINLLHA